jgi:DNA polymerase I-like protein with 3'-5' exonuclease and polymerase domains
MKLSLAVPFYELEMPMVPILADMENYGIGFDAKKMKSFIGYRFYCLVLVFI